MTPLLPVPDHLGHGLHGLSPLVQTALEGALPHLSLDLLADTGALDAEAVLGAALLNLAGQLRRPGQQRGNVVFLGQLDEFGLAAQRVGWRLPAQGPGILPRQERVDGLQRRVLGSGGGGGCSAD